MFPHYPSLGAVRHAAHALERDTCRLGSVSCFRSARIPEGYDSTSASNLSHAKVSPDPRALLADGLAKPTDFVALTAPEQDPPPTTKRSSAFAPNAGVSQILKLEIPTPADGRRLSAGGGRHNATARLALRDGLGFNIGGGSTTHSMDTAKGSGERRCDCHPPAGTEGTNGRWSLIATCITETVLPPFSLPTERSDRPSTNSTIIRRRSRLGHRHNFPTRRVMRVPDEPESIMPAVSSFQPQLVIRAAWILLQDR
jgi:hypothetical protein